MTEDQTLANVVGGTLRIRARGPADGERILFLHGGPGLSDVYLDGLIDEFADTYRVATYAQRGVAPSTAGEPFDLDVQAADAIAVLDALGWPDAILIGHSWGGHLLLHLIAARTGRLSAAIAIDPIGSAASAKRRPSARGWSVDSLRRRERAGKSPTYPTTSSSRSTGPATSHPAALFLLSSR